TLGVATKAKSRLLPTIKRVNRCIPKPPFVSQAMCVVWSTRHGRSARAVRVPHSLPAVPTVRVPIAIRSVVPWTHHNKGCRRDDYGRSWRDNHRWSRSHNVGDWQRKTYADSHPSMSRQRHSQGGKTENGDQTCCCEKGAHPSHGTLLLLCHRDRWPM